MIDHHCFTTGTQLWAYAQMRYPGCRIDLIQLVVARSCRLVFPRHRLYITMKPKFRRQTDLVS